MLRGRIKVSENEILEGVIEEASFFPHSSLESGHHVFGKSIPLEDCAWLPPSEAKQFISVCNNSRSAMDRYDLSLPSHPLYFAKPASSFAAHGEEITIPANMGRIVAAGELGIVIGRTCRRIDTNAAADFIQGYTCVGSITAIEVLSDDPGFAQWTRAKGLERFTPFGPHISTELDPDTFIVEAFINGQQFQRSMASDLIFSPWELVSKISDDLTLSPGDVIACGASVGYRAVGHGDVLEIAVSGVGTLRNRFLLEKS
jgi:2-keto-4-pentenoate hydratase/2-oxohepta-3-ene-1,7-dioic acid hydratase in catechol pathway